MRIILTPFGSNGDVFPFLGIGKQLQARGHEVKILTGEPFRTVTESLGLSFHCGWSAEDYETLINNPDIWQSHKGPKIVFRAVCQSLASRYEVLSDLVIPNNTLLVGHTLSFPTRVYEEVHQIPAVTVHLSPSIFRSQFEQPIMSPRLDMSHWPRWTKRFFWWLADKFLIDPRLKELNRFREKFGLEHEKHFFKHWIHSPNKILALFPDWFATPQSDWPSQLSLTGFPLFDMTIAKLDSKLEDFIQSGYPPILFTPGTANRQAQHFFTQAIKATKTMGQRALLLTSFREQLPEQLPEYAMHVSYAPFSKLLTYCAAAVHHGGIGTCSQGLAAGIPQLIMPMAFDQPDNANRLQKLNVARWLMPKDFTADNISKRLEILLNSFEVAKACRYYKERIKQTNAIAMSCDIIEKAGE
jgi:rhamnosyltransferase subunit B